MSQFNYADYAKVVERAQNSSNSSVKVGFFKLANDGDEALVRINCSSVNDLQFASVHQLGAATKWMKVSCLNEVGSYNDDKCPLCAKAAAGDASIGKAKKVVYIQMMVAYRDKVTGQFSAPIPVVWERPAGFSREIANKLRDFGDLKEVLLKITRNGKAGDMKTTYSIDYAVPTVFKPELVPADFSAFANFNIAKHSYWEKSEADINTFLATGLFPETGKSETVVQSQPVQPQAFNNPAAVQSNYASTAASQTYQTTAPETKQPTTVASSDSTPRNFGGWSF